MLRQGQMHQQQAFYQSAETFWPGQQYWLSPDQFATIYPWPGVKPIFSGGEEAAGAASSSEAAGDRDDDGIEKSAKIGFSVSYFI